MIYIVMSPDDRARRHMKQEFDRLQYVSASCVIHNRLMKRIKRKVNDAYFKARFGQLRANQIIKNKFTFRNTVSLQFESNLFRT